MRHQLALNRTPSPTGLPVYAEALAMAFANASSDSLSYCPSPRANYDSGVLSYFDVSASESGEF